MTEVTDIIKLSLRNHLSESFIRESYHLSFLVIMRTELLVFFVTSVTSSLFLDASLKWEKVAKGSR